MNNTKDAQWSSRRDLNSHYNGSKPFNSAYWFTARGGVVSFIWYARKPRPLRRIVLAIHKFHIRQWLRTARMYTYRRVLAHPLRFELRSHGFGGQDNTVILKVHKIRVYSSYQRKTRKNVTVLRLTEVTVLMSNDL